MDQADVGHHPLHPLTPAAIDEDGRPDPQPAGWRRRRHHGRRGGGGGRLGARGGMRWMWRTRDVPGDGSADGEHKIIMYVVCV